MREPDEDDRRVAWVRLTPAGRTLLERSRRRKEAYLAKRLRELEPGEVVLLEDAAGLLERLTEGAS